MLQYCINQSSASLIILMGSIQKLFVNGLRRIDERYLRIVVTRAPESPHQRQT